MPRGKETSIFFKLFSAAPRTVIHPVGCLRSFGTGIWIRPLRYAPVTDFSIRHHPLPQYRWLPLLHRVRLLPVRYPQCSPPLAWYPHRALPPELYCPGHEGGSGLPAACHCRADADQCSAHREYMPRPPGRSRSGLPADSLCLTAGQSTSSPGQRQVFQAYI